MRLSVDTEKVLKELQKVGESLAWEVDWNNTLLNFNGLHNVLVLHSILTY
jgi:hypothetical protein